MTTSEFQLDFVMDELLGIFLYFLIRIVFATGTPSVIFQNNVLYQFIF